MRSTIALTICVCLFTGIFAVACFAEDPMASTPEWTTIYEAGLAASSSHRGEQALDFLEGSWKASRTSGERGLSAASLGQTFRRLGRMNEAKEWLDRARQELSTDPRLASKLAIASSALADLYRTMGDYSGSERLLREALASPACAADSRAMLRNNLADLLREEGRSSEAQPLFKESVDLDAIPWQQRVGALIGLAEIDRQNGNWTASAGRWGKVLEICRREHDEKTEAIALRGLGMTWLDSGSPARAEPLLRRGLRMMEDNADMPLEEIANAHSALAQLYRSENKLTLAEDELSRALQIDNTVLGPAHPQIAVLMARLSDVYSARGEFTIARDYAMRASESMRGSFGENSMPVATALTYQATIEQRAGDLDAAAKDYERAIRIARSYPEHRSLQVAIIQRYAELLKTMHRRGEAKALDMEARSYKSSDPRP
jgi:tetratricopeptide (TPR) repeat protein